MRLNGDGQLLAGHRAGDLRLAASRDRVGFGSVERSRNHQLTVHRQGSACRNDQFLSRVHRQRRTVRDLAIGGQGVGAADDLALVPAEQHAGFHAIIARLRGQTGDPTVPVSVRCQRAKAVSALRALCGDNAAVDIAFFDAADAAGVGTIRARSARSHRAAGDVERSICVLIVVTANAVGSAGRIHDRIAGDRDHAICASSMRVHVAIIAPTATDTGRAHTDCGDIRIPIDRQTTIFPRSIRAVIRGHSTANTCSQS